MYHVLGADQKEYGPVGADQIRQWILERRLNSSSLIRSEGEVGWKPLSMLPEFATAIGTAAPISPSMAYGVPQSGPQNPMAVTGLVLSCIGLLCCPCSTIFGLVGIIFSVIALSQLKANPGQRGKELAIAGIAIGALAIAGFVVGIIAGAFGEVLRQFGR